MRPEYLREGRAHDLSLDYHIDEAVFEHELGGLEIVGKLLFYCAFYDTAAGKSDKHFRFCDDDVTEARERGRDTAGGRVGHYRDIELTGFAVTGDSAGRLCHLHKGYDALLHSCTAGGCEQHDGESVFGGIFKSACDLLTYDASHTCHHEVAVHYTYNSLIAVYLTYSGYNSLVDAAALLKAVSDD